MIYIDRAGKREVLRCYLMYANGFSIEWQQKVNAKEEIVGVGGFNQNKIQHINHYKKKGFGDAMHKRILGLSKNSKSL